MPSLATERISEILECFNILNLGSKDSKGLTKGHETKYVLSEDQFPDILRSLQNEYSILEVNNLKIQSNECIYFDTKKLDFYKQHHNGKLNRIKVRYRRSLDDDRCDFEIKINSNTSLPFKKKLKQKRLKNKIRGKAKKLLKKHTDFKAKKIKPKLTVQYKRIVLVHKNVPESIVFDTDLFFTNGEKKVHLENVIITKLIKNHYSERSEFLNLTKLDKVQTMGFSKYCTGIVLTNPGVKHNRFKHNMLFINKLINGDNGR